MPRLLLYIVPRLRRVCAHSRSQGAVHRVGVAWDGDGVLHVHRPRIHVIDCGDAGTCVCKCLFCLWEAAAEIELMSRRGTLSRNCRRSFSGRDSGRKSVPKIRSLRFRSAHLYNGTYRMHAHLQQCLIRNSSGCDRPLMAAERIHTSQHRRLLQLLCSSGELWSVSPTVSVTDHSLRATP